jgi:uncharacterized protein YndB with AHSA1/START domain
MREPIFLDDPHRPAVRVVRQVEHPIDEVWAAITAEDRLRTWFPGGAAIEQRVGGEVRFGEGGTGHVLECDPPRRLAFTWADDRLSFELEPDAGGTMLALTHDFDDRAGAASYATGWERCLGALVRTLDGQPAPATDRAVARHEQLVERFELHRPVIVRDDEGWHARFARQLTAPAEVAWNAFLGVDPRTGEQRSAPPVGDQLRPYAAPDVVLGTVGAVDPPHRLALSLEPDVPGDRLELELTAGTGHGARLLLDVYGADAAELDPAIDEWGNAVAHVARDAAAWEG